MTEGKPVVLILRYIRYLEIGSGGDRRGENFGWTLHRKYPQNLHSFLLPEFLDGIRPQDVTHQPVCVGVPGMGQSMHP